MMTEVVVLHILNLHDGIDYIAIVISECYDGLRSRARCLANDQVNVLPVDTSLVDILVWQCHDVNPYGRTCRNLKHSIQTLCPGIVIIEEDLKKERYGSTSG